MSFILKLKTIAKSFPILVHQDLEQLETNLEKSIVNLSRLRNIVQKTESSVESKQELQALHTMKGLCIALNDVFDKSVSHQSIYALLAKLISNDNAVLALAVHEWANLLMDELSYESNPLNALADLVLSESSSIQFTSFLLCLLRKKSLAATILDSDLLHQFFNIHCTTMDEISKTYRLLLLSLQPAEPCESEARELCRLVSNVRSPASGLETYALNGLQSETVLPLVNVKTRPFVFTQTSENWNHLYGLFKHAFLIKVLSQDPIHINAIIKTQISTTLRNMPHDELIHLYQFILSNVSEDARLTVFNTLGKQLSNEQQQALLASKKVSVWILLAANHALMNQLDPKTLKPQDIPYAVLLCQQSAFLPYRDITCKQLFKLLVDNIHLERDDDLLHLLQQWPEITSSCRQESTRLMNELRAGIDKNSHPFTEDSYINIQDLYRVHGPYLALFVQLSREKPHYPLNTYELQSLIIEALFLNGETNLLNGLDIMHPVREPYTHEDSQLAKYRALYECLSYVNNTKLQQCVITTLTEQFSIANPMDGKIDGTPLIDKALLNNNTALLAHYFPATMSEEARVTQLNQLSRRLATKFRDSAPQSNTSGLVIFMLHALRGSKTTPEALKSVLMLYPQTERFNMLMSRQGFEDNTLFHCAAAADINPQALLVLLTSLSEDETRKALKAINHHGDTVLHAAVHNGVQVMTAMVDMYASVNDFSEALLVRNKKQETVLHAALGIPAVLKMLWSFVPRDQKMNLLIIQYDNDYPSLLNTAINFPSALPILLESLTQDERVNALMCYMVMHSAATLPEAFKILLNSIVDDANIKKIVQVKDGFGHTVLHRAAIRPLVFNMILTRVADIATLLGLLELQDADNNTVLHAAACCLENMKQCLTVYPEPAMRLDALKRKNKYGETILHRASPDVLIYLSEILTAREFFDLVMEKDNKDETRLHREVANPNMLNIIFNALPVPDRLSAVLSKNKEGESVIKKTGFNSFVRSFFVSSYSEWTSPESLMTLLSALPMGDCFKAVYDKEDHLVLFKKLVKTKTLIDQVLPMFLPEQRLVLLKENINLFNDHRRLNTLQNLVQEAVINSENRLAAQEPPKKKMTFVGADQSSFDVIKERLKTARTFESLRELFDEVCQLEAEQSRSESVASVIVSPASGSSL